MAEVHSPGRGARQEWGVIPGPIHRLLVRLTEKTQILADSQNVNEWPPADVPSDFNPFFKKSLEVTQGLHATATDLRSLVSAWAHKYHEPKPNFSELARAQGSTPQGLYKRYKALTRDGIEELLSEEPRIEVILKAFPSLQPSDLRGLSEPLDRALDDMRARMKLDLVAMLPEDRIDEIAIAVESVRQLNGHEPDDGEIRELLSMQSIEPTPANVSAVRAAAVQRRER